MNPDNVINLFHKEPKQTHHEEYTKFLGEIDDGRNVVEFEVHAMDAPNATRYWLVGVPFTVEQDNRIFAAGHTDHEVRQWAMDMIQRTVKCRITLV